MSAAAFAPLVSTKPIPCKACGARAGLFGVVDFGKSCEDRSRSPQFHGIPVYYRRCADCGFIFTDAFDAWSHDEFRHHIYNDGYAEVDPDYRAKRPEAFCQFIVEKLGAHRDSLRILDYGGGNGRLAKLLKAKGFRTVETYDPFVPKFAAKPNGTFDVVTCFETLEHLPDPRAGTAELAGFVDNGGMALFSTVTAPTNIESIGVAWWYIAPRNGHISIFSADALARLWRDVGLQAGSLNTSLHIACRELPWFAAEFLAG